MKQITLCPNCGHPIPDTLREHLSSISQGRPPWEHEGFRRLQPLQRRIVRGVQYYLCSDGTEQRWLDRHGKEAR